ncbi:hypothetical protein ACHAWT_003697 [Skeletonema menzelii]
MSSDEVIELSIEETQALRAKLGLVPLRLGGSNDDDSNHKNSSSGGNDAVNTTTTNNNDGEISLSIDETNALRLKIGLPPLNINNSDKNTKNNSSKKKKEGSSISTAIYAPPTNTAAEIEARKRLEDAQAKREVRERLLKLEQENREHAAGEESALNFAARMMQSAEDKVDIETKRNVGKKKKKKKKGGISTGQLSIPTEEEEEAEQQQTNDQYTSADLQGIQVSHATSEFQSGSTTILTLADNSILTVDPDTHKATGLDNNSANNPQLINVNMASDSKALENLKRKRQIELGMGRAGGYAGYDDDEFEELGGVGVLPNSLSAAASAAAAAGGGATGGRNKSRGFAIGANGIAQSTNDDTQKKSDLFSSLSGGAVSLESRYGSTTIASDFMTNDDDDDDGNGETMESKEDKLEKERAKHMKLLEKMRKKNKKMMKKKDKKKKKRRVQSDDEDESEEEGGLGGGGGGGGGNSLIASLEATAVDVKSSGGNGRKRRTNDDGSMDIKKSTDGDMDEITAKKDRFDQIMQKGKMRTDKAFQKSAPVSTTFADEDNADDDAFLNAALAKARRLKRLKDMNGGVASKTTKGEDAVVNAVEKIKQEEAPASAKENGAEAPKAASGGLTFEFDEMQEFTRALRAREDQAKRAAPVRSRGVQLSTVKKEVVVKKEEMDDATAEPGVEDVDMEEMAREMKEDGDHNNDENDNQVFGTTTENSGVGRGMSGFLSLLKQTGEIKNSGKEEMRGRAKDKRTYEDYDSLDLKKVVKINSINAQEKDIEFANREIKLEYRDDHGRLLTRKEAYRNMCYQFHGHGSSKKNEERRQKQIEREREENKLASRQGEGGVGTLGALKATQKATGKAFIVHKT